MDLNKEQVSINLSFDRTQDMIGKFYKEVNPIEVESKEETYHIGIYCPSYKRYNKDQIITYKVIPNIIYVVRKTEYQNYLDAGIDADHLIGVEDKYICSASKVRQWILECCPEEVIVMCDDDIKKYMYMNKYTPVTLTEDQIIDELVRNAICLRDLKLGYGALAMTAKPQFYTQEYAFLGGGGTNWYNKRDLKAKNDYNLEFKDDVDMVLQELLYNRITFSPRYIGQSILVETNAGGCSVNKNTAKIEAINNYLNMKWGKYYYYDKKKNVSTAKVKR